MNKPNLQLVTDQLARIASDLESEKGTRKRANDEMLAQITGLRNDMRSYFHGNGDEDKPGIVIELDRLKQNEIRRQKQHVWIWTSITGIGVAVISKIITDIMMN